MKNKLNMLAQNYDSGRIIFLSEEILKDSDFKDSVVKKNIYKIYFVKFQHLLDSLPNLYTQTDVIT